MFCRGAIHRWRETQRPKKQKRGSIFIPHMRHAFETIEELRELEATGQLPDMDPYGDDRS